MGDIALPLLRQQVKKEENIYIRSDFLLFYIPKKHADKKDSLSTGYYPTKRRKVPTIAVVNIEYHKKLSK